MIRAVSSDSGITNLKSGGERITGFNSESSEIKEDTVRFGIVFYMKMKDKLSQIIVNIEAKKSAKKKSSTKLISLADFYAHRLVSLQKKRDFVNISYNDKKCIYTIISA